jgi:hypothetical protein
MMGNTSVRQHGEHLLLLRDDVIAFVEGRQSDGVEVNGPDPVVGFFQADVLINHRIGQVQQLVPKPKRPAASPVITSGQTYSIVAFRIPKIVTRVLLGLAGYVDITIGLARWTRAPTAHLWNPLALAIATLALLLGTLDRPFRQVVLLSSLSGLAYGLFVLGGGLLYSRDDTMTTARLLVATTSYAGLTAAVAGAWMHHRLRAKRTRASLNESDTGDDG